MKKKLHLVTLCVLLMKLRVKICLIMSIIEEDDVHVDDFLPIWRVMMQSFYCMLHFTQIIFAIDRVLFYELKRVVECDTHDVDNDVIDSLMMISKEVDVVYHNDGGMIFYLMDDALPRVKLYFCFLMVMIHLHGLLMEIFWIHGHILHV